MTPCERTNYVLSHFDRDLLDRGLTPTQLGMIRNLIQIAISEAVAAERKACADAVRALRIGPAFDGAEHPSTRILNKAIAAIEGRGAAGETRQC